MLTSLTAPALAQDYGVVCAACGCLGPSTPLCRDEPLLQCNCIASVLNTCECLNIDDDAGFCDVGDTCPPGYVCVVLCDSAATRCIAQCPA